jgi:hypothetical protein
MRRLPWKQGTEESIPLANRKLDLADVFQAHGKVNRADSPSIYPHSTAWYNPSYDQRLLRSLPFLLIAGGFLSGVYGVMNLSKASVDIDWETATELDTVGFNVYRADSPDGTLSKVNDTLIPASSEPLTGGKYSYLDRSVKPGMTYYYYLEDVDVNGVVNRNGPTVVKRLILA